MGIDTDRVPAGRATSLGCPETPGSVAERRSFPMIFALSWCESRGGIYRSGTGCATGSFSAIPGRLEAPVIGPDRTGGRNHQGRNTRYGSEGAGPPEGVISILPPDDRGSGTARLPLAVAAFRRLAAPDADSVFDRHPAFFTRCASAFLTHGHLPGADKNGAWNRRRPGGTTAVSLSMARAR